MTSVDNERTNSINNDTNENVSESKIVYAHNIHRKNYHRQNRQKSEVK